MVEFEGQRFEIFEVKNSCPLEVQEYLEYLRSEITKAFTVPEYLMRPKSQLQTMRRAFQNTEILRREVDRILVEHFSTVLVVKRVE